MSNQPEHDSENISVTISAEDVRSFKRLDKYLTEKFPSYSRTFIKRLFENGLIELAKEDSSIKIRPNKMPHIPVELQIQIPAPIPIEAEAENIPLEILYQDEHLIFVNKPAGLVTHPAPGNYTGTLVNAVLFHCKDLQAIGDKLRPGIVHRLDKGTSGVMVVAKSQAAHEGLVLLFSKHDIERKYLAITYGVPEQKSGTIESTIGRDPNNRIKMKADVTRGKKAITHYQVIAEKKNLAVVECTLETGRTHQIRVHLAQKLGTPILCDSTYGNTTRQHKNIESNIVELIKEYPYPFLHAEKLGLVHPVTQENLCFTSQLPEPFHSVVEKINE